MSDEQRRVAEEAWKRDEDTSTTEGVVKSQTLHITIDEWKGRIAVSVLFSVIWAIKLTSKTRTVHEAVMVWLIFAVSCGLVLVPLGEPQWGWWGNHIRTAISPSIALLATLLVFFFGPLLLNVPGIVASVPTVGIVEDGSYEDAESEQFRIPAIELQDDSSDEHKVGTITDANGTEWLWKETESGISISRPGPVESSWAFFKLILFTAMVSIPVIVIAMVARDQILAGFVAVFQFGAEGLERVDRMVRLIATILAGLGVIIGVLAF